MGWKKHSAALLAGLTGGFILARGIEHRSASEPTDDASFAAAPAPGVSPCVLAGEAEPASDADALAACLPDPSAPMVVVEGPSCSFEPHTGGHAQWIFDASGNPVALPTDTPFAFAYLHGQRPMPMGDRSIINGAVMHVAQLTTSESPDAVLGFYRSQFELNHQHPVGGLIDGNSGPLYLALPFSDDEPMRTLTLVPSNPGTVVLASVGTPKEIKPSKIPGEFPVPGEPEDVTFDTVEDGPTRQRDMSFRLHDELSNVQAFYQHELEHRGFQADDLVPSHGTASWNGSFRRGAESISLSLMGAEHQVHVSVLWIAPIHPEKTP